jgi:serine/threonine protein kinase
MQPGEIVSGRFEIQTRAGSGGMGDVYRAIDRQIGAPVALKVLPSGSR